MATDNGPFERSEMYRDSKNSYLLSRSGIRVNGGLVKFCCERAGKRILDYGCATGDYCVELKRLGYDCTGVDINEAYVESAKGKGVDAYVVKDRLPFEDKSFDTIIIFEVLEHLKDPGRVIAEAKRVARKNILISVPDNSYSMALKGEGLTYDHMLELDHINFFTRESMERMLASYFKHYSVTGGDPRFVHHLLPWWVRKPLTILELTGIMRPTFYSILRAEGIIE